MNAPNDITEVKIDGYVFKFDESNSMYECRGETCYDDEHDEVPEPGLWKATVKLEKYLTDIGYQAEAEHSEKGWCEVNVVT